MNELKAYKERIKTYSEKIESLKITRSSLATVMNMSDVEKATRTDYLNDSIEMFEEKITHYENKIKTIVEELETQCKLLAESFGELETEDYLDEIEGIETFCYISSTQAHNIFVNYDYDNNNFDVYINSTHGNIKLNDRIISKRLSETYERVRKVYIELGNQYSLTQAD